MLTSSARSSRTFFHLSMLAALLIFAGLCVTTARAADVVSVTKECPGSTCSVSGGGQINISGSSQTVQWFALHTGTTTTIGRSFILRQLTPVAGTITLSSSLTVGGTTNGSAVLSPGTYEIDANPNSVGPGSYSVSFNLSRNIAVSPTSRNFGSVLDGSQSAPFTFTVSFAGDAGATATISSVTSSSPRFVVVNNPSGQPVPPSQQLGVRFVAQTGISAPVTHNETITITGPSNTQVIAVSGTSLPNLPDIDCNGSCAAAVNLGSADGDVGEVRTFNVTIRNTGSATLQITSITLVNDTGMSFSLTGATALAIPGGATAQTQVRFAPPPGEAVNCAHLVIQSNDPDEATKSCFFRATAHHPVPQMQLVSNLLDYGDVELGFTFHKAIIVRNVGDAPLSVTVSDNCSPLPGCSGDAEHARWIVRNTGTRTVAPNASTEYHMDYRPNVVSAAPDAIVMRVTSNDPDPPDQSRDVNLRGRGIAPVPIDSVLVLDRSGSMADLVGQRRKIEALQTAGSMFVELLRPGAGDFPGDRLGLVRYNNLNDVYLPFNALDLDTVDGTGNTHRANALDKLSVAQTQGSGGIVPDGGTGIGGGMQTGAGLFPTGALPPPTERKQMMVVLTDGMENVDPRVATVLPAINAGHPNLKIYSVGLGRTSPPAEIDAGLLQSVTNVTNGYHQVSADLSGVNRFQLESFYFKIFANATGMSIVVDPTTPVQVSGTAPIIVNRAQIVSSDRSVTFMVLDDPVLREFYELQMVTPSGQVLTTATVDGGIAVQRQRRYNYDLYRVIFPDVTLAAGYVGEWQLRLAPNGKWNDGMVRAALDCPPRIGFRAPAPSLLPPLAFGFAQPSRPMDTPCRRLELRSDPINPFQGLVPVGFGAAVNSDYRMDVRVQPSHFLPTADVRLTATLTDRRAPALDGEVFVDVTTPSNTNFTGIRLFDDGTHGDDAAGDGTWTTHFIQTAESGSYRFFFRSLGRNGRGEVAPREETRYLTLAPVGRPEDDPRDPDGKDGGRTPWFSFHLGHSFPSGSFRREFDAGPSLTVDAEFPVSRRLSVYSMFGYHYFHARRAGDPNLSVKNLSLNLRAYFPLGSWQGFVQAGPGAYFQRPGTNEFGYNVGAGLNFPILPRLMLELGADVHHVNPGGLNRFFFDPKLGIKFRF